MADSNMIDDVRTAKSSVDSQSATFEKLGAQLREIERAYHARTGDFSTVPAVLPVWVRQAIEAAQDEPGRELLGDVRSARPQ